MAKAVTVKQAISSSAVMKLRKRLFFMSAPPYSRNSSDSAAAAAKAAGISRSAFYKYKDYVFKYSALKGDTLNLNALLSDRAGVFSALTAELFSCGANIITVSQGIPENGTANASLTVSTGNISPEELIKRLLNIDGVISIKRIDGGKQ